MDDTVLKLAVPALLLAAVALGLLVGFLFNVGGTWERIPDNAEDKAPRERLTLGQLGPFVRGRRDVTGGWQEYSGLMWGRQLKLTRRDFGVVALKRANFPEPLAKELDGDVFAELRLELVEQGTMLQGTFTPQKIDFLLAPPRITQRYWMPAVPRSYRRVTPAELLEPQREPVPVGVKEGEPA
ncbi:MAG: hypothetical protein HY904_00405 [Deltaproteobacteria bacterium]|nr:hypothetical protein [Deltaproteobacteria bacterium]